MEVTRESTHKSLVTLHIALLGGMTLFALVATFLIKDKWHFNFSDLSDIFLIVVPILTIVTTLGGFYMRKIKFKEALESSSEEEALMVYRSGSLIRYALAEGTGMFAIVAMLLTANAAYLIFVGLMAFCLLSLRPSRVRMDRELDMRILA